MEIVARRLQLRHQARDATNHWRPDSSIDVTRFPILYLALAFSRTPAQGSTLLAATLTLKGHPPGHVRIRQSPKQSLLALCMAAYAYAWCGAAPTLQRGMHMCVFGRAAAAAQGGGHRDAGADGLIG